MRRVLYALNLDPSKKFGSLEEQIRELARASQAEGGLFLPLFNAPVGAESAAEFRAAGVEVEGLNLQRFRLDTLGRLIGLIRARRIEIVDWNFFEPIRNGYLWALSIAAPGVRHYYTDHISRETLDQPSPSVLRRSLKRALFTRYEKVICVSDFLRGDLAARGVSPRFECRTHFINTDRFRPDPMTRARLRAELGADGRFVVVAVAQLHAGKGVEVALQALRELPGQIVFWIVGEGPEQARLEGLCRAWSLGERVRFLGQRRNVAPFLQAADCLLCPSLWAEAAGLVILEAMGCGLPVVASRIGGIPEYVIEGTTGALVPAGDHQALAEAVRRLHDDPALRKAQGRAARERAVEWYSPQRRIPEYLDLYRTAVPKENHVRLARPAT